MARLKIDVTAEEIVAAKAVTVSMSEAAKHLGVSFATFKRRSIELGLYAPNQGKPGVSRPHTDGNGVKVSLEDILAGKHPNYGTTKLKRRLIEAGLKQNVCETCGISEWMGKPLVVQLDHIDGNSFNHSLDNLRTLCPNCHSQTDTFCRQKK